MLEKVSYRLRFSLFLFHHLQTYAPTLTSKIPPKEIIHQLFQGIQFISISTLCESHYVALKQYELLHNKSFSM